MGSAEEPNVSLFNNKLRNKFHVIKSQKNILKCDGILKNCVCYIYGMQNEVTIQSAQMHHCSLVIRGNNNKIVIGDNSNLVDVDIRTEDSHNEIMIGKNTTVFGKTHLAAIEGTKIIIGDDCMFSSDILVQTGDAHSIIDDNGNRINRSVDIRLGDHVWVGTRVTCLKGAAVGANSIIGAGTLLSKDYSELTNVIVAGTPAKVIRSNINWLRARVPM